MAKQGANPIMRTFFFALILSIFVIAESMPAAYAQEFYGRRLCSYPQFTCIKVKRSATWNKMFPNAYTREIVMRLNRTNGPLNARNWIVVPTNLKKINYLDLAPFPLKIPPPKEKLVVVNLPAQAFAAYDTTGAMIHWGPISAGRDWCQDIHHPCRTAVGNFRVFNKEGPDCESQTFPVNPIEPRSKMPYCMYFFKGFALHGASLPGFHASHGCVRLFNDDAKWLNKHFTEIGTRIIVIN
jgi:L,D-transpeptidase ErfK/SrfK